jgi:hypothetical protein
MSTESHNNSRRIDQVLDSLEGIQQAKAPAFMYTRLKARMDQEFDQGGPLGRWLTRPALALSIAAIILVLNATTLLEMWKQNSSATPTETAQLAVTDYPVSAYPVYEENPIEP